MATYSHAIGWDDAILFVYICAQELHVTARLLIAKLNHVSFIIKFFSMSDVSSD